MLYMIGNDGQLKILILETANLDRLKAGKDLVTPDKSVLLAWCPDVIRLGEAIQKTDGSVDAVASLIEEARAWPEAPLRPPHEARYYKRVDFPETPDAPHPAPGPDVGLAPPAGGVEAGEHPPG